MHIAGDEDAALRLTIRCLLGTYGQSLWYRTGTSDTSMHTWSPAYCILIFHDFEQPRMQLTAIRAQRRRDMFGRPSWLTAVSGVSSLPGLLSSVGREGRPLDVGARPRHRTDARGLVSPAECTAGQWPAL